MSTYPAKVAFGIDVGGSGIKGAPVDLKKGTFYTNRTRIPTPGESTPEAVAEVVRQIVEKYGVGADMPIGIALMIATLLAIKAVTAKKAAA